MLPLIRGATGRSRRLQYTFPVAIIKLQGCGMGDDGAPPCMLTGFSPGMDSATTPQESVGAGVYALG